MKGEFMKQKLQWFLVTVLMLTLLSCTTTQEKWNELTPDEKARIIIGDIQAQLDGAFDSAKLQIGHKPEWKTKAVPAFDMANKAIADVIKIGKTKPLDPAMVYMMVQTQVSNALNLCVQLGWIKK